MKLKLVAASAIAALIVIGGCGGDPISVRGKVLVDSSPLEAGSISFEPADGKGASFGGMIADGRYELKSSSVHPGKKRVHITAVQKTGRKIAAGPPLPDDVMVDEVTAFHLPPQEVDLAAGKDNEFSFDL